MRLERGSVLLVALDPTRGHEQRGQRPCVVVSSPEIADHQRYPLVALVPLTGTPGEGLLYPRLQPGRSGLRKMSWALIDQIRSVDKRRVLQLFGHISKEELGSIDEGLRLFLGLRGDLTAL
jgi:mRNA interferase MazF